MKANWARQSFVNVASAPGGPPYIGMHLLPTINPTVSVVVDSNSAGDCESNEGVVSNADDDPNHVLNSLSSQKNGPKVTNGLVSPMVSDLTRMDRKNQLPLGATQWPVDSATGDRAFLPADSNAELSCGQYGYKKSNSSQNVIGSRTPDQTSLVPPGGRLNGDMLSVQPVAHTQALVERPPGLNVQQAQPASSTCIPDVCRSDVDRLKRLHYFTTQQARSVEELTRRHRKLDHLQRCLKRYEIERYEAGQAVRRIEDRLKELRDRTSDLLSTSMDSPGQIDSKMPFDASWSSKWNYPTVDEVTTLGKPMGHSSDCPVIPPLGPVGRKTSRVVRRPSKHRIKEDLSLQTTANHMYVDSEQMLQSTPVPELQPNFNKLLGRSSPMVTSTDMTSAVAIRCQLDQGQSATASPPAVPAHSSPCGCLQQQQISIAQRRIAELEARHKTLVEHLNLQRNRLAAADATVVSLARTLLQFTMKNEPGKVPDSATSSTDRRSAMTESYQKPICMPANDLVNRLRNSPLPGSMDSLARLNAAEGRQSNGLAGTPVALSGTVSSSSMDPIAWTQAPPRQSRLQQIRDPVDISTKNANEYIDLAATDSVDRGVQYNGCRPNNNMINNEITTRSANNSANFSGINEANITDQNMKQPSYGAMVCNRLPNYFASTTELPESAEHAQPVFAGFFTHPTLPTAQTIPAPPLPPKPNRRDDDETVKNEKQHRRGKIEEEEERTVEDEEVTQYMCRQQEPQQDHRHHRHQQQQQRQQQHSQQNQGSRGSLASAGNGTYRPPPPPYYVNLFGSDSANTDNENYKQLKYIRKLEKRQSSMESGVTNTTLTSQSSTAFTDKTPETVIEMAQSSRRNIPSTNELKDVNFVENERDAFQPTVPQGLAQALTINQNMLEYLNAKGHDTKELSCELPQPNEAIWPRMMTPSTSCFNSKVARWFRSGLGGSIRTKPRHHSMDDKDNVNFSTPFWQWIGELRVRLITNRCEGFLWIRNQQNLHQSQQSNGRRSHPWHSLRVTYRGWSDSGTESGRDSPNISQPRNATKLRHSQWTRHWFTCDVPGQLVTYQDTNKMDRIKGSFRFPEIRHIQLGLNPNSDTLGALCEETTAHHQSDPEGSFDFPRQAKQSRLNRPFYKHKTRTADWLKEPQTPTADDASGNADELDQLVFHLETWMQVYVLKAATPALRNLWVDVFHYAIESSGT